MALICHPERSEGSLCNYCKELIAENFSMLTKGNPLKSFFSRILTEAFFPNQGIFTPILFFQEGKVKRG
jgi:hypothetical protein